VLAPSVPFRYQLTQVVLEKRPLTGVVVVVVVVVVVIVLVSRPAEPLAVSGQDVSTSLSAVMLHAEE